MDVREASIRRPQPTVRPSARTNGARAVPSSDRPEEELTMPSTPKAGQISVDQFAEATFAAVLRALQAERKPGRLPLGPIIYGIIAFPEAFEGQLRGLEARGQ
jgi:hypothetical protein